MKIIIVGATGTIGQAIVNELKSRHEIIAVGLNHGDFQVNIEDAIAIENLYKKIGRFDALISVAGSVHFADFSEMDAEKYQIGLRNKLMGQVNLVLIGKNYINHHGSFTLTSGVVNVDPIAKGSSAAMVNGALDAFVGAAAIEMPRGIRINAVSPTVIAEAMEIYADYFRGFKPVAAKDVALAYIKSIEGLQTGKVFRVGY